MNEHITSPSRTLPSEVSVNSPLELIRGVQKRHRTWKVLVLNDLFKTKIENATWSNLPDLNELFDSPELRLESSASPRQSGEERP